MAEHVFQPRRESRPPTSARTAAGKSPGVPAAPPSTAPDLHGLRAALNDTAKVKATKQLKQSMSRAPRAMQLAYVTHIAQRNSAVGQIVQRLELTDAIWKHITQGELRDGKKLVGYHWTGDDDAIARKNGTNKEGPDERGVYVEGVETIEQFGQGRKKAPISKANASTFWPDAWTEADIKNAIANGGTARNTRSEVSNKATKAEARGMTLIVNPDSIFPELGETAEPEVRGGRNKGGGKRR